MKIDVAKTIGKVLKDGCMFSSEKNIKEEINMKILNKIKTLGKYGFKYFLF